MEQLPTVASRESFAGQWARRAVTIPVYLLAAVVVVGATPALLFLALLVDVIRPRRFALVRSLLMADVYLLAEVVGIAVCGLIWATSAGWRREPSADYLRRNFALQCRWASAQFWSAKRIFGLRIEVDGEDAVGAGPVIVVARHVSPVDNLVPAVFLSDRRGLRLRWVINRWLLRDPCLDVVGNRLPNLFVDAGRDEGRGQAARVGLMAKGLGPGDGVLLYPEGALFTVRRRARVVARLMETDPGAGKHAGTLRHLLPPRTGGFVAALAAVPSADVVVCSHAGLELASSYHAFLSGEFVGARIRIRFRRISRTAIPATAEGQAAWLWEAWAAMDDWLAMTTTTEEAAPKRGMGGSLPGSEFSAEQATNTVTAVGQGSSRPCVDSMRDTATGHE